MHDKKSFCLDDPLSHRGQADGGLDALKSTIIDVYGEELWTAIKTGMGVVASLSFEGVSTPISLLYEGGAGRGKSTIINVLDPDRTETREKMYRLDKFTPKSFVTHAANVDHDKIAEIDLLPKLKDKTLLTKELAPMFRGRDDELRENFATLAAVLDGKGLVTSSGVHGTRGYDQRCVFNWLGATTPVPAKTDAIMAQLGNRLLRYEICGAESTEEELLEFAQSYDPIDNEEVCRKAVNQFLVEHFARHPLRSVDRRDVSIPKPLLKQLVRLCELIAHARVEVKHSNESGWQPDEIELTPGIPEGPQRIILYVRTVAQGLALVSGRRQVNAEDLAIVRHIAFSSIPTARRDALRATLMAGGTLDAATAETILKVSRPTARLRMRELAATGIVQLQKGGGNRAETVTIERKWNWLLLQDATEEVSVAELPMTATFAAKKVPLWVIANPFRTRLVAESDS